MLAIWYTVYMHISVLVKQFCDFGVYVRMYYFNSDTYIVMAQSSATELFEQYYKTLIYVLPMKDATFMDELLGNGLLTGDVKIKLDSLTVLNQRASYFLDSVIKPELAIGRSRSFVNLLTIMKSNKYDNVKELAKEIENELAIDIKCKIIITINTSYTLRYWIGSSDSA